MCRSLLWPQVFVRAAPGVHTSLKKTKQLPYVKQKDLSIRLNSVADPWHFGTDPDSAPEPAIFVINLQDANKKLFFSMFSGLLLFEGTFT
jgi:hypothetical protein